jgi:hypothetical protein
MVAKFGRGDPEPVVVVLAVINLPRVTTDVLISFNASGAAAEGDDILTVAAASVAKFNVHDWGLFGE